MVKSPLLPIAVLISGGGTTLKNLIERKRLSKLPVEFRLVVSSNPTAKGLALAQAESIPTAVIRRRDFAMENRIPSPCLMRSAARGPDG